MKLIFSALKSLTPDLTKDRLIEDLRNTRVMLENLAEIYHDALPAMRSYKYTSKEVIERIAKFQRIVGTRDNPVVFFDKNIPLIIKNLDMIKEALNAENRTILAQSLTIRQANLLNYVTALYLINKGARKFLVWIAAHEAAQYNNTEDQLSEEISPAEEKWLSESFVEFCQAVKIGILPTEKTLEKLESIPDAQANEKAISALNAAGRGASADPLSLGLIGTQWNPILFARMLVAEWQVARYNEAEDELRALRLQLTRLENNSKGKNDPRLEQEIKYMRGRVAKLAQEVAETESKYA